MSLPPLPADDRLAILYGGGIDSSVLIAQALAQGKTVQPLYVRCGLLWEATELAAVDHFLAALTHPRLLPPVILDQPVADLYGDHWSLSGRAVPDASSPDEAVYLPGRNLLLLAKPLLWCAQREWPTLALATLGGNPFADASQSFFDRLSDSVAIALGWRVTIVRPLAECGKLDVMRLGEHLPLERTFSCLAPQSGLHCGRCNKCQERRQAFLDAQRVDLTDYAASPA